MSDRYERCSHNEQPSKCIYCAREQIDALRAERDKLDEACKYHADNASKMGRELEATQLDLAVAIRERDELIGMREEVLHYQREFHRLRDERDEAAPTPALC